MHISNLSPKQFEQLHHLARMMMSSRRLSLSSWLVMPLLLPTIMMRKQVSLKAKYFAIFTFMNDDK